MPYLYETPSRKFSANIKTVDGIKHKKILAFAPHSDDLSIGAGGFLSNLAKTNTIVPVCAFSGWRGVNKAPSKKEAILIREKEMHEEAEILSFKAPIFLDLETYESDEKSSERRDIQRIKELVGEIKPNIIFLPNKLDLHPRHKLLTKLILSALGKNKNIALFFYEIPWSVFSGNEYNFIVPLSKEMAIKKIRAIEKHKSQLKRTNFVKLAKALLALRAGMVPEQKITGYGSKFSLGNWVEVYNYKGLNANIY